MNSSCPELLKQSAICHVHTAKVVLVSICEWQRLITEADHSLGVLPQQTE